jgi:Tfp pilus assembly PilM family ATPase
LEIGNLFEDLRERFSPLRGQLFPQLTLIELHDDSIRAQVLEAGRPGKKRFDAPLPAFTCRRGVPLEPESLGDLIGDLMLRDDLINSHVVASIPPEAVEWRVLEWPRNQIRPDDPLASLRSLDPEPLRLPFSLEDAAIDVCPLPGLAPRALLAASSQRIVEAWIKVFAIAELKLDRLAPTQSCEYLGLRSVLERVRQNELVVLLSPDGPNLRLLLVRDEIPCFDRTITLTGEARIEEVERSVAFYRRRDREVKRVRLVQGTPVPEAEAVGQRLGVPVETLSLEFDSLVLAGLAIPEEVV